jgi:hypothetical protein
MSVRFAFIAVASVLLLCCLQSVSAQQLFQQRQQCTVTLPASCHFLLEHSAFLTSVCRTFNTLFGTEWPVDAASLRSHVHLAGPSLQEDEWSCGYHLLFAWSLLLKSLLGEAASTMLTPSRVTAVCAAMEDTSAVQLVEFTSDRYDAVVAAAPVCKGTSS